MVEICVDGWSQLGLITLVVKFEQFSLVIALAVSCCICVIIFRTLCIHHFDLIIEQPHRLDLVFELEPCTLLVQLLGFSQVGKKDVDDIGIVVKFKHSSIKLAFLPCIWFFRDGLLFFYMHSFTLGKTDLVPYILLAENHHSLFFIVCLPILSVNMDNDRLNLHNTFPCFVSQLHLGQATVLSFEHLACKVIQTDLRHGHYLSLICSFYFLEGSLSKEVDISDFSLLIAEQN